MAEEKPHTGGSPQRAGDWTCAVCNNHNYAFRDVCNRCKSPLGTPPGAGQKPGVGRPGDWICGVCANNNYAFRTECNSCHKPRAEVEAGVAMPVPAVPADWPCPQCEFLNFGRRQTCKQCRTRRPLPDAAPPAAMHPGMMPMMMPPYPVPGFGQWPGPMPGMYPPPRQGAMDMSQAAAYSQYAQYAAAAAYGRGAYPRYPYPPPAAYPSPPPQAYAQPQAPHPQPYPQHHPGQGNYVAPRPEWHGHPPPILDEDASYEDLDNMAFGKKPLSSGAQPFEPGAQYAGPMDPTVAMASRRLFASAGKAPATGSSSAAAAANDDADEAAVFANFNNITISSGPSPDLVSPISPLTVGGYPPRFEDPSPTGPSPSVPSPTAPSHFPTSQFAGMHPLQEQTVGADRHSYHY